MSLPHGIEASIRQLIAGGKSKTALDQAKDLHKRTGTAESEALLIDAYLARIEALSAQNLTVEAKSLTALLRDRFPSAKDRLDSLKPASMGAGDFDELVGSLNNPELTAERRVEIERFVQTQVTDLVALSKCAALPPEHGLRLAAAAIENAFNVVTSGPVTDEQIALAEISHRSPLAPWKLAIRAIASFYRGDDGMCEEYLAAIRPEAAPARVVRAMRAAISGTNSTPSDSLRPAEKALLTRINAGTDGLRKALSNLDRSFAHAKPGQIFADIRSAVKECRQQAPDLLPELRRRIAVRCEVAELDSERAYAALEGAPRRDAAFFQEIALALEGTRDSEDLVASIAYWDNFRQEAARAGWFAEKSAEAAAVYLHMARLSGRVPPGLAQELGRPSGKSGPREANYFFFPAELYGRACVTDPHRDAFAQWLKWAKTDSAASAEQAAIAWSKVLPADVEPLLFLMEEAERRKAFPTALSWLDRAERIDGVNPIVRTARLRLLATAALSQLQKKKPHLAAEKMLAFAKLPQSRQGGRPAFLAAMQYLIVFLANDQSRIEEARAEAAEASGDPVTADLLIFGCATLAKQQNKIEIPLPDELTEEQRAGLPLSMAKISAIASDIGLGKFQLPVLHLRETEAQFASAAASLDIEQIRALGEMGIASRRFRLAWDASAAGLERGGAMEGRFLLMRAEALPESGSIERRDVLLAAAAALGRVHGDSESVGRAVEAGRDPFDDTPLSLTADQAREVLRREKASAAFPSRYDSGPDYSDLLPEKLCMCPACQRERAGAGDPEFPDEEAMKEAFFDAAPEGVPSEILPELFEAMKASFLSGLDPDEVLSRVLGGGGGRKKKKGRRR